MQDIKVGMIGAGQIAKGHCQGINAHPNARVVAVADLSDERAKALATQFDLERTYSKWEDLVADGSLDAVSIALPNSLHAPVAQAALAAGKHVMLDKPFALNLDEARATVAAAEASGKVFTLGMNQRFRDDSQTLRALVGRGDLGEVYHAKAYWRRRSGAPKFGTWFGRKDLAGGGCLLDIGVHVLDLCLYIIDNFKPVSVSGCSYTKFGHRGIGEGGWGMSDRGKHVFDVDDFSTGLVKFADGTSVQIDASWVLHQAEPNRDDVEVFGTEAGGALKPARLFQFGEAKGEYHVTEVQGVQGPYAGQDRFGNWIDAILGQAELCVTAQQALAVQAILDGIYRSSETGQQVDIAL